MFPVRYRPDRARSGNSACCRSSSHHPAPTSCSHPAYTCPLWCSVPIVLVIHDVSFAAHPEWFSWREGLRRRTLTRLGARRASRVITESDFSKREITRLLGIAPSNIDVIYLGASTLHQSTAAASARHPLVLYVGLALQSTPYPRAHRRIPPSGRTAARGPARDRRGQSNEPAHRRRPVDRGQRRLRTACTGVRTFRMPISPRSTPRRRRSCFSLTTRASA